MMKKTTSTSVSENAPLNGDASSTKPTAPPSSAQNQQHDAFDQKQHPMLMQRIRHRALEFGDIGLIGGHGKSPLPLDYRNLFFHPVGAFLHGRFSAPGLHRHGRGGVFR